MSHLKGLEGMQSTAKEHSISEYLEKMWEQNHCS